MMKVLILLFISFSSEAYVPTVESLFRHGANADVTANGVTLTMSVKRIKVEEKSSDSVQDVSLLKDENETDYYKVFFTKTAEGLKVSQARYKNESYSENSLVGKIYYPNLNAFTFRPEIEASEKGIFFGLLNSMVFNNGAHIVNYLKSLGIPLKLNNEIINREKVELLADYKRYLVTINKSRMAKKSELNPLQPQDIAARERVQAIMGDSMYTDTKQVKLSKDEGEMVWMVEAGPFEAIFSYKDRDLKKIKYKSTAGDYDISFLDYWLANGSHLFPRFVMIKTLSGQQYQIEVTGLRHYIEREEDLLRRLKNWDQILKGKDTPSPRPEFLL